MPRSQPPAPPVVLIAIMLALFGALLLALQLYQRRRKPHPEVVRKLFHIGSGLLTLTFPWLFVEAWPVFLLTGSTIALLFGVRRYGPLRTHLQPVVGGVARPSLGEIYFPVSVAALFVLAHGRPLLFVIPMLILTLADAVSAIIGVRFGAHSYVAAGGRKSIEGSLAFFLIAFAATFVPLVAFSGRGWLDAALLASTLGLLVMLLEASAWRGLDNLFIPLGSFLLLRVYLGMDGQALQARLIVAIALLVFVLVWQNRTTLEGSGLVAGAFTGYLVWALGGWRWVVPPLALFMAYTILSPRTEQNSRRIHDVHAVLSVMSCGLMWLAAAFVLGRRDFFWPYATGFAAHLTIIGIARLKYDYPMTRDSLLLAISILKAWLIVFAPLVAIERFARPALLAAGAAPAGATAAALLFYWTQPRLDDCPTDTARWVRQALAASVGSLAGLLSLELPW